MAIYDLTPSVHDSDWHRKARIEDEMLRADYPASRNAQFLGGMSRMAGDENHPLASQVLKMVSSDPLPMSNPQFKVHREIHGY